MSYASSHCVFTHPTTPSHPVRHLTRSYPQPLQSLRVSNQGQPLSKVSGSKRSRAKAETTHSWRNEDTDSPVMKLARLTLVREGPVRPPSECCVASCIQGSAPRSATEKRGDSYRAMVGIDVSTDSDHLLHNSPSKLTKCNPMVSTKSLKRAESSFRSSSDGDWTDLCFAFDPQVGSQGSKKL